MRELSGSSLQNIPYDTFCHLVPSFFASLPQRHRVEAIEDGAAADKLVVELVVARWGGQEGVAVGHKQVEDDHNLR